MIAVAAFTGTAVLAIVLAKPQARTSTGTVTSTVMICPASGLDAWVGTRLPNLDYSLEFTNISRTTCVLNGYPSVTAYDQGQPVGSPAANDGTVPARTVLLPPGATAHALLRYQFRSAACHQVTAPELRVYPPQSSRAMLIHWRAPACSRRGPRFLSVQPVQPVSAPHAQAPRRMSG